MHHFQFLPFNVSTAISGCITFMLLMNFMAIFSDSNGFFNFTVAHRSICSGSSTPSSQDTKTTRESSKITTQTGLSVVRITFPEAKKTALKKSKI